MNNLPTYVSLLFILTSLLTVYLFYRASGKSFTTLIIIVTWMVIQALVASTGFYTVTNFLPPRFVLMVLPPLLLILFLLFSKRGQVFVDRLDIRRLTLLHTVRLPVEIALYLLFTYRLVPQIMTFEGGNLDILSGLTAPLIYHFALGKGKKRVKLLLGWNIICLCLLVNIVIRAALSTPSPVQKFAFAQPNIAVQFFPFNWLPCCIVPIVLLSHLVIIRKLVIVLRTPISEPAGVSA